MKGSIKCRSRGSFTITLNLPCGLDGKRRREYITFRGTRKEAEAAMARRIAEIEDGKATTTVTRITVAQFMAQWLEHKRGKGDLAAATIWRYEDISRRFIVPTLGHIPIRKLGAKHIEDALASWRKADHGTTKGRPLSPTTVHHIFNTLRAAMSKADQWEVIARNPCRGVDPVKRAPKRISAIDETEALSLIDKLDGSQLRVPVLVAVMTGLRRGELLALRWSNVDLDRGVLHVERATDMRRGASPATFKAPKTERGRRTIPLAKQAITALRTYRSEQLKVRLQIGPEYNALDLVFPNIHGEPWHPELFSTAFARAMKRLGVKVTFHGLRHSYASILLRAGVTMKVASEALGHANIGITADTYTHVLGDLQQEAANRLASAFDAADQLRKSS